MPVGCPNLSEVKRGEGSVDWCTHILRKFDGDVGHCRRIRNQIYQYDPEMKQLLTMWVSPNENLPVKLMRSRSALNRR